MPKSFATDILPLFRPQDINCMRPAPHGVLLDDYAYMSDETGDGVFADHANARHVFAHLTGDERPQMPKGGPFWSEADLATFEQWMTDGFAA
jgi:hypothetical protein